MTERRWGEGGSSHTDSRESKIPSPETVRMLGPLVKRVSRLVEVGDMEGLEKLSRDLRVQVGGVSGCHAGVGTGEEKVANVLGGIFHWAKTLVSHGVEPNKLVKD